MAGRNPPSRIGRELNSEFDGQLSGFEVSDICRHGSQQRIARQPERLMDDLLHNVKVFATQFDGTVSRVPRHWISGGRVCTPISRYELESRVHLAARSETPPGPPQSFQVFHSQ